MEPKLQKAVTAFKPEELQPPRRHKSLKPNTALTVYYNSEINIHQYVSEMNISPCEAVALSPAAKFPPDTFESLGKGPMNFLILCGSVHYDNMFLYLSKQTAGETFGCTDDSVRVCVFLGDSFYFLQGKLPKSAGINLQKCRIR